jgi:hypothetical protein
MEVAHKFIRLRSTSSAVRGWALWLALIASFNLGGFFSTAALASGVVDQDQVVLAVEYQDGSERDGRQLTLEEIMALPLAGFATSTIWTDGVQQFEGVWLKDLVKHIEVEAGLLELSALNEYLVDFPVEDIADSQALVAYRHNGELMSARSRGPLWVVFPYDHGPEFRTEPTYVASIWQLDLMVALP